MTNQGGGTHTGNRRVWLWVAVGKMVFLSLLALALWLAPEMDQGQFYGNMIRWPIGGDPTYASHWATWDAPHYFKLAGQGYKAGEPQCAFYPLWPGMLAIATRLTGMDILLVGLLLSNLIGVAAVLVFRRFAELNLGSAAASNALILLLVFPGSLFLNFAYTEALFLLLLMGLVLGLEERKIWVVAVCAALLPLCRASGQFVLVPLVFMAWRRRDRATVTAALSLLAGVAAYYGMMWVLTGNAFEGVQAQKHWSQNFGLSGMLWLRPLESLEALPVVTAFHSYKGSFLDRFLFLVISVLLWPVWKRNREAFWWLVALAILPALFNSFTSMIRYAAMAWPVFLLGGSWLANDKSWKGDSLLLISATLHLWLTWRHVNFLWAG